MSFKILIHQIRIFQKEGSGKKQLNWLLVYVQPVIVIVIVVVLVTVVNSFAAAVAAETVATATATATAETAG